MQYLSNAFSINMLSLADVQFLRIKKIRPQDVPQDVLSVIGHKDIAAITSTLVGFDVHCNRASLELHDGDILYVAQYRGPRLPEGTTELPEGAEVEFYEIRLPENPCNDCQSMDCGLCRFKEAGLSGCGKSRAY